jgi:SAM-dependent methyltransferase
MNSIAGVAIQNMGLGYRSSNRSEVLKLLPQLKPNLKILEIGCGEGRFCAEVPGAGETWGIEPDPVSADIARGRLDKVFASVFEETKMSLPLRYFDLVVCNDVIEHMTDHDGFLRSIQDYMAPGSFLVGSLPNVRFHGNLFNLLIAGDWHYQDNGILDRTHLRFFTLKSFRRSLEENGFEVKRLEGLTTGLVIGWNIRAVAQRIFRLVLVPLSGAARDIKYFQFGFLAAPVGY